MFHITDTSSSLITSTLLGIRLEAQKSLAHSSPKQKNEIGALHLIVIGKNCLLPFLLVASPFLSRSSNAYILSLSVSLSLCISVALILSASIILFWNLSIKKGEMRDLWAVNDL